ncbi:extracellular solute-binding protein [Paenibacillus sp. GYB004]|uniref:ABC transporter substrate-binding protein n=1 Tax=Paenibacillus sp. GYB004 TaxID=2994393 RepID=UPI002F9676D7
MYPLKVTGKAGIASTACIAASLLFAAGCTSGDKGNEQAGDKTETPPAVTQPEPVQLTMLGSVTKEKFMEEDGPALKKKFPHITIDYYLLGTKDDTGGGQVTLESALATRMQVDLMAVGLSNIGKQLVDTKLAYDISELIKKHGYNLNILYPQSITAQKSVTGGALYGLPVNRSAHKIYYNKDLFDKFGEKYPKDGLTWDETYEIAKKMTRNEGGVQYLGAVIDYRHMMLVNQLSIGMVDPVSHQSLFVKEPKWQRFVSNLVRFQQIPGNEANVATAFTKEGRAAMYIASTDLNGTWTGINWDIAKAPTFADLPGVGSSIHGTITAVTSTSKHKDEAFQVVAYLASEENMLNMARRGTLSVLNDPKAKSEFGKNIPWLNGKTIHAEAMFPDKLAEPYTPTPYDAVAQAALVKEMTNLATGKTADVNTALRVAAEEADKAIAAQKGK